MNLEDMTPVGGGDLRGPAAPSLTKLAGTFTPTAITDPATIWNPRGREIGIDTSTRYDPYRRSGADSERPARREHVGSEWPFSFSDVGVQAREALRP